MTKQTKKTSKTTQAKQVDVAIEEPVATLQTSQDFKTALLVVSVGINLFIFITWLLLQVTTQFDAQVVSFLFSR